MSPPTLPFCFETAAAILVPEEFAVVQRGQLPAAAGPTTFAGHSLRPRRPPCGHSGRAPPRRERNGQVDALADAATGPGDDRHTCPRIRTAERCTTTGNDKDLHD